MNTIESEVKVGSGLFSSDNERKKIIVISGINLIDDKRTRTLVMLNLRIFLMYHNLTAIILCDYCDLYDYNIGRDYQIQGNPIPVYKLRFEPEPLHKDMEPSVSIVCPNGEEIEFCNVW
jgi:hypothetical protein